MSGVQRMKIAAGLYPGPSLALRAPALFKVEYIFMNRMAGLIRAFGAYLSGQRRSSAVVSQARLDLFVAKQYAATVSRHTPNKKPPVQSMIRKSGIVPRAIHGPVPTGACGGTDRSWRSVNPEL